ncbi:cytochrome P450 [Streptomyces sp. YC504]|uniref:Cytochrome P450 n=1 Tax=Streptomyces mesophilus TaxID=1775132 RepID=A0A6G4XRS6_9ACTN|nr:cytochrome P450 [Streptomyces mesophilus]NGO80265.1 cytochrome P450 [Streptomyces mesophilus]
MTAPALNEVNLLEDTWAREVPHAQFKLLRREDPVHWHELPDGEGFYAITKHEDIIKLSRDPELWSVEKGSFFIRDQTDQSLENLALTLVGMDPPKHSRFRKLVNAAFAPRMIRKLTEDIKRRADLLAEKIEPGAELEFVETIASRLPLEVICEMMGIPPEDEDHIIDWSNRMVGFQDPDFRTTPEDGTVAAAEIYLRCNQLAEERQSDPRDDIVSALVHGEVDGEKLTTHEINMFFVTLIVAGNETTRNLLSGALLEIAQNDALREDLARNVEDDALWRSATEEFLRWNGSIHNFRRTATRDTEVRGVKIREGQKAVLFYTSGNRDEDIFENPDVFDPRRAPNDHVTFGGGGPHFCLGSGLARTEINAQLRAILRRCPNVELTGEHRRMRSDFINGIKHLPVRFS